MEFFGTSLLSLLCAILLLRLGIHRGLWAFLVMTPFGAAAAFNLPAVGGASIGIADVGVLVLLAVVLLRRDGVEQFLGTMRFPQPGFYLLVLVLIAVPGALLLPRVFVGETIVFSISRSANESGIVSLLLRPGTGNITQAFRFCLAALAFFALATAFRARPDHRPIVLAIMLATCVHFALGVLDVLSSQFGAGWLLDPIRTANYAILSEHQLFGIKRMVGGFPEASAFGEYSLALFGFWLVYAIRIPASRSAFWMLLISAFLVLRSTSSTAYVSVIVLMMVLALLSVLLGRSRTVSRRTAAIVIVSLVLFMTMGLGLFMAYEMVDPVRAYLDRLIFDKLDSASGVERMSWNAQAFQNFLDTWGLGAGLGSVRASNWLLATMASLGIFGTLVYITFIGACGLLPARTGDPHRDATLNGLKAACLASFIAALLTSATPNLGIFFFALAGLAVGLSRGAQLEMRQDTSRRNDTIMNESLSFGRKTPETNL